LAARVDDARNRSHALDKALDAPQVIGIREGS
jgi:hypothetical protein